MNDAVLATLGIGGDVLRTSVSWAQLEPRWGEFDQNVLMPLHQHLVWHGTRVVLCVKDAPSWLGEDEIGRTSDGDRYPRGHFALNALEDLADYLLGSLSVYGACLAGIELWAGVGAESSVSDASDMRAMVDTVALATRRVQGDLNRNASVPLVVAGPSVAGEPGWESYLEKLGPGFGSGGASILVGRDSTSRSLAKDLTAAYGLAVEVTGRPISVVLSLPELLESDAANVAAAIQRTATNGRCLGIAIGPLQGVTGVAEPATGVRGQPMFDEGWSPTTSAEAVAAGWKN